MLLTPFNPESVRIYWGIRSIWKIFFLVKLLNMNNIIEYMYHYVTACGKDLKRKKVMQNTFKLCQCSENKQIYAFEKMYAPNCLTLWPLFACFFSYWNILTSYRHAYVKIPKEFVIFTEPELLVNLMVDCPSD